MRLSGGFFLTLLLHTCLPTILLAQSQTPSERCVITCRSASEWGPSARRVIQADGPVTIELDRGKLSAASAVIWVLPGDSTPGTHHLEIVLLGDAVARQGPATRTGTDLFVTAELVGEAQILSPSRADRDLNASALFRKAEAVRDAGGGEARLAADELHPNMFSAKTRPVTRPQTRPALAPAPVSFEAAQFETTQTPEGTVGVVLSGGVTLFQRRPTGEFIEMRCERAVMFTTLKSVRDLQQSQGMRRIDDGVVGVYLEGDVRIVYTPVKPGLSEQRLNANRVFYDFTTDRAILTDAVLHSVDVQRGIPIVMRARVLRQISAGEYEGRHVQLTTSTFALPSLALAADRMYVRTENQGPGAGEVYFRSEGTKFETFGVPFFYLPVVSGTVSEDGDGVLRSIGVENRSSFGFGPLTEFGLFETLGQKRPRDLDAAYRLDYFSERGPAVGLTAAYSGGFITETTKQPWDFSGDLQAYMVYDKGTDDLNRLPVKVGNDQTLRGRILFEHQHIFPDGWQAQLRLGYVSDASFLESWFRRDFEQGAPSDQMIYLKHQDQTEAFTLGIQGQLNGLVTTSDLQQEQFEVERLPQATYHRIGDSFLGDQLTFFSDNSLAGLHFHQSRATLREQGFGGVFQPGLPDLGTTGLTSDVVVRADFRQEIDYPFTAGPVRVVPYIVGRATEYSDSPRDGQQTRIFGATGLRLSTEMWKTDPTARSDLFDIHQIRHTIVPEINLFASAQTVDRGDVFIYDEPVDAINDVQAAQVALHQRWQTKRGGPGAWRSVDVFTLNVEANFFANKPSPAQLNPRGFRSLFFSSLPEASVPRNGVNVDASWRISDNTVVLADAAHNLDKSELATAAIGLLVRRDIRTTYYVENRYIAQLQSNITSVHFDYAISSKYNFGLDQGFDFSAGRNVYTGLSLVRRFDTFLVILQYTHNETTGEDGVSFNLVPSGLNAGLSSASLGNGFRQ